MGVRRHPDDRDHQRPGQDHRTAAVQGQRSYGRLRQDRVHLHACRAAEDGQGPGRQRLVPRVRPVGPQDEVD
nr:hypothetical protein [Micromonospora aurantiaca]